MFGTYQNGVMGYGTGGINPYSSGFSPGSQQLKGRQVASVDEVKAAQVDFSGNISYYPCPNQNVIYAKYLDLTTGAAVILEFKPQPIQQPQYADVGSLKSLEQRITNIEQMLGGMANANATTASNAGKQ